MTSNRIRLTDKYVATLPAPAKAFVIY